jgi:hypothetical protein
MGWATFWEIFSQAHQVTLAAGWFVGHKWQFWKVVQQLGSNFDFVSFLRHLQLLMEAILLLKQILCCCPI